MLYITEKSANTTVILPRNSVESAETYEFALKSQATAQSYSFSGLTDMSGLTDYLVLEIDSTSVPDGEYEYSCGIEKGVIRVGAITPKPSESYEAERKYQYYQY